MNTQAIPIGAVLLIAWSAAVGEQPPAGPAKAETKPAVVTMAVLDYEISLPGEKDLGSQVADILTVRLSIDDSIRMVERAKLGKIIEEQKLKLVGVVDQDSAVKVGKLLGARILIMGKGFLMDKKLVIVTKIVGVETGQVVGGIRQVELSGQLSTAIMLLSEDIANLVKKNAGKLLPKGQRLADPIAAIRKMLGKRPRPSVAVIIPERHRTRRRPTTQPVDPAVETEIKQVLIACGFPVVETGRNDLADWARAMSKGKKDIPFPATLDKADVIVVGEAFSEFALRTGDLVTCIGRAEINAIDRHSGRIIHADRTTQRAVDLAEAIAGKTALQKAGRRLALALCRSLADHKSLSAGSPSKAGEKAKK